MCNAALQLCAFKLHRFRACNYSLLITAVKWHALATPMSAADSEILHLVAPLVFFAVGLAGALDEVLPAKHNSPLFLRTNVA